MTNQETVKKYFTELMNKRQLEVADEIFTPDFVFIGPANEGGIKGAEGFKKFITMLLTTFPDFQFIVMNEVAGGNQVASHYKMDATHQGNFVGIPATGKHVSFEGLDYFFFENGKIQKVQAFFDIDGMKRQLS